MSVYTPNRIAIATGLDEIGINLGLTRIEGESLSDYRNRLLLETREPSGPTQREFIRSLSRKVGAFDVPVFRIDLVKDANDIPLAADAYLEVTSSHLKIYSDHEAGLLDVEVNFYDRADGYFLEDVWAAVDASTYFTIEILDEDYEYKKSRNLRFGNTDVHVPSELTLPSQENKLVHGYLKTFAGAATEVLVSEKSLLTDVQAAGDFYVDYVNGVVFTYDFLSGAVTYTYRDFPYDLYWQKVRVYPLLDSDKKYFHYDTLISDTTGEPDYVKLNSHGAWVANQLLVVHPMTWGE